MSSSLPLQREPQAVGTLITRDGKVLKSTSSHFIQETLGMFLYLFVFCVHALPYLFVFIYLFLAARGLCCCVQPCSGCGQWELLASRSVQASRCDGFSSCRAWSLGAQISVAAAQGTRLWLSGPRARRLQELWCGLSG